tara:strand:- start:534 stop:791 length:258 start_codon:yes stop_codon:yes gene_type:complete
MTLKAPKESDMRIWHAQWRIVKRGKLHYIMAGKAEVCRIAPGLHKDIARLIRSAPSMRQELSKLVHFISDEMPGVVAGVISNRED